MPGHLTEGTGSGFWRTPSSTEGDGGPQNGEKRLAGGHALRLRDQVASPAMWPTPRSHESTESMETINARKAKHGSATVNLTAAVRMWPTPGASKATQDLNLVCSGDGRMKPNKLGWAVAMWPTPTVAEATKIPARANYGQKGLNNHPAIRGLPDRPKMSKSRAGETMQTFPTPCTRDHKDCGENTDYEKLAEKSKLAGVAGGQLNADWVEWLMGWPIGWTDCAASATDKFRQWCDSHGRC